MAGYPPQQHYTTVHQPPHVAAYHAPNYPIHPPPTGHHPYPSHLPPGPPYQPTYTAPPPPSGGAGGNTGSGSGSQTHASQQHGMHQVHNGMAERVMFEPQHQSQSARPSQQAPQPGPSLSRPSYGNNAPVSQSNNVAPPPPPLHAHLGPNTVQHSQGHAHHQSRSNHPQANYGVPMHPRDYDQQPGPPGPRPGNQHHHVPPSGQGNSKRSNASARDKEREAGGAAGGPAPSRSSTAKGGGAKRGGQEKQGGGVGSGKNAGAEKIAASAVNAANDEPIQESKKIRKRKEVVDRIHRVHWDTIENREILYNDMQHALATTSSVLLLSPSLSRPYLLALYRLTLERDAQLRQSALLHAHQVDSARLAYEQEKAKVEEEARTSKKVVREKLLAAVEDRRRRLREDKEGGEGMSDALLDSSSRPHATRKLRNKGSSSSKREADSDASLASRVTMPASNGTNGPNASSLGLLLSGSNGAGGGGGGEGSMTPRGGEAGGAMGYLGSLGSLAELNQLSGFQGPIASLPPSNFDSAANNAVSLLHLQGVGGGMGDSSFMLGSRVALQNQGKSKKKPSGKGTASTAPGIASGGSGGAGGGGASSSALNGSTALGGNGTVDEDDEGGGGSGSRSVAAAAAAASIASGAGRLRWDQGKSVGQLSSAKDIEIESDLINIRKSGAKRRRR